MNTRDRRGIFVAASVTAPLVYLITVMMVGGQWVPDAPGPVVPVSRAIAAVREVEDQWAGTEIAVSVVDRVRREKSDNGRGEAPMYTASVVKLITALDVLDRAGERLVEVTDRDRDLLARALSSSDDDAMNELWVRFDGAGGVARMSDRLGLTQTSPPEALGQWGMAVTSANDVARVYEHLLTEISSDDREFVLDALGSAPAVAAGGFHQDFGLLTPALAEADPVAKQGWMCCADNAAVMHSTGMAGDRQRFIVVVLTSGPATATWEDDGAQRVDELTVSAMTALLGRDVPEERSLPTALGA